jgi:hypothetical protein
MANRNSAGEEPNEQEKGEKIFIFHEKVFSVGKFSFFVFLSQSRIESFKFQIKFCYKFSLFIFLEYTKDELRKLLGLYREPKKKTVFLRYKRFEPDTPLIEKYDTEDQYMQRMWLDYGDELPPYKTKICNIGPCTHISGNFRDARRHAIKHLDSSTHDKFLCPRCEQNFGSHKSLRYHGNLGRCFRQSDFPSQRHFNLLCLAEHPQQAVEAKRCHKCGFRGKSASNVHKHFVECVRFPIVCPRCDSVFVQYYTARLHYENTCDGTYENRRYYYEQITPPPLEEKEKKWSEREMMEYIRRITIPQLRRLIARFPPGALLLIGQTENVRIRDQRYNIHAVTIRRAELEPFMELNEMILFRCWTRYDALLFEYLLQHHTIDESGEFHGEFGDRVNHQFHTRPTQTEENTQNSQPYYVYLKATRQPWSWADARHFYHEDMPEATASQAGPSSSSQARPSKAPSSAVATVTTTICSGSDDSDSD